MDKSDILKRIDEIKETADGLGLGGLECSACGDTGARLNTSDWPSRIEPCQACAPKWEWSYKAVNGTEIWRAEPQKESKW
jgi:hypothetical protein